MYAMLEKISSPDDLRTMSMDELRQVATELRAFIHETVTQVGGHLSSNLGTIELTVALHHVYQSPADRIVWDVGHQTYAHKVLTGRRQRLATIRQLGGLSGFPSRSESDHDAFGTAHASTSIAAAMGMAVGGQDRVVAVIGDSAMSGGMAFEGLNNVGVHKDLNLLVILNDNDMSISPAVGALRQNLARVLSSTLYDKVRSGSSQVMPPTLREFAAKAEEHLKGMVLPGTLFEEFGFDYFGPIDGHDLEVLVTTLRKLRDRPGPRLLHIATVKGKGYAAAERDPVKHHGVAARKAPQKVETQDTVRPTYSQIFGQWVVAAAQRDARVYAVTPAMREGSGLVEFERQFPDRYFDCGIAEQHAVTFCAGLACCGQRPVLAIYSTFLQRGYDQLIHDVAIQNLPVIFAIDRAGLVGADGATHQGAFDLSYLRCIPNLTVMVPSDENECWQMLNTALELGTPAAVRYPRGAGPGAQLPSDPTAQIAVGQALVRREGQKLALLAFGPMVALALAAAEQLDATVVDMRFAKPLDHTLLNKLASTHTMFLTVEENVIAGGAGSAVAESFAGRTDAPLIGHLGLPDAFIDHGTPAQQLTIAQLTVADLVAAGRKLIDAQG